MPFTALNNCSHVVDNSLKSWLEVLTDPIDTK